MESSRMVVQQAMIGPMMNYVYLIGCAAKRGKLRSWIPHGMRGGYSKLPASRTSESGTYW